MIFVCFIIVVPLTMFAIIWVAAQMTNKVNRLSHSMSELKMDDVIDATQINELVPEASSHLDEIDTLTVTCANMITELNASFESNLNLKIQEEKLNYQLLQSQINPHFYIIFWHLCRIYCHLGKLAKQIKCLPIYHGFTEGCCAPQMI